MAGLSIVRGGWTLAVVIVCVACGARTDIDELAPGVVADASAVDASTGGGEASLADVPSFSHDAPSESPPPCQCNDPTAFVAIADGNDCGPSRHP